MKKDEVKVGGFYLAKVSGKLVTVRIDSTHSKGGWNATNTRTGKRIRIKSARRLRGAVKSSAKAEASEATKAGIAKDEKARVPGKAANKKLPSKQARSNKADGTPKAKRVSALDAAAQVLKSAGKPMRARELITAMAEQGLWSSPAGKTPWATLYAAMLREARDKGNASRFRKVARGMFVFNLGDTV